MAQLLTYAFRRPLLTVDNLFLDVKLFDGDQLIQPLNMGKDSSFSNLFRGETTGPVGQALSDEVTHFNYGCVLDRVPESDIKVVIKAYVTFSFGGVYDTYTSNEYQHRLSVDSKAKLYYSYIKDELNRKQAWLDEFASSGWPLVNPSLVDQHKNQMVKLSTTTNILCSLTAFIGVKNDQSTTGPSTTGEENFPSGSGFSRAGGRPRRAAAGRPTGGAPLISLGVPVPNAAVSTAGGWDHR